MSSNNSLATNTHIYTQVTAATYPNLYEAFQNKSNVKHFSEGETIVFQAEKTQSLGLIDSGTVEIHITSVDGDTYIAEQIEAGSVLNGVSYLDAEPSPADVIAKTKCAVRFLPYKMLRNNSILDVEATKLTAYTAAKLYRLAERLFTNAMLLPLRDRIIRRLTSLSNENAQVKITAEKLAIYLGVSKYKVHRLFKILESEGLIKCDYGLVTLLENKD